MNFTTKAAAESVAQIQRLDVVEYSTKQSASSCNIAVEFSQQRLIGLTENDGHEIDGPSVQA